MPARSRSFGSLLVLVSMGCDPTPAPADATPDPSAAVKSADVSGNATAPAEPAAQPPSATPMPATASLTGETAPAVAPPATAPEPLAPVHAFAIHGDATAEGWALRVELSLRDDEPGDPLAAMFLETACRKGDEAWLDVDDVSLQRGSDASTPLGYVVTPFAASRLAAAPDRCQLRLLRADDGGPLSVLAERCLAGTTASEGACADFAPPPPDDTPLRVLATHVRRRDGRVRWDWLVRRGRDPLPHPTPGTLSLMSACIVDGREVHAEKTAGDLRSLTAGDLLLVSTPQSTAGPQETAVLERCDLYLSFRAPGLFDRPTTFSTWCFLHDALHEGLCRDVDPPAPPKVGAACTPLLAARGNDDAVTCDQKLTRWYPADVLDGLVACMVAGPYRHGCFEKVSPPRVEPVAKEACRRIDDVLRKDYHLSRHDLMDYWPGVSPCGKLLSVMTDDGRKAAESCMTDVCEAEVGCAQSLYDCAEGLQP